MLAYIGIGSNLGDRRQWIDRAVEALRALEPAIRVLHVSAMYETEPDVTGKIAEEEKDPKHIPLFLNNVVEVETTLEPEAVLKELLGIERSMGRLRPALEDEGTPGTFRPFLSRNIDLDLLFYGDRVYRSRRLTVPHRRAHRRSFVMIPLRELNPNFIHPVLKQTVSEICREPLAPAQIRKVESSL